MKTRYILRDEPFGITKYDRLTLRHVFLKRDCVEDELSKLGYDVEMWPADLTDAPRDIIFSPLRIYFELTNLCNLRCKPCFNSSGKPHLNELVTDEAKKSLKGMRADNIIDMRFTGGEVTQRPDWFDLLSYAKELGFSVSLNTNGVYEDPSIIDKLIFLDLEQITMSVDGDRDYHDYMRGRGNFDKTVSSMAKLYKKAHIRINTLLTKGSARGLEEILELANRFAEEINFFYMRTAGRALDLLDQAMSVEELSVFGQKVEGLKLKYPGLRILHSSQVMQMNSVDLEQQNQFDLKIGGPDGFTRLNLLPDGSIWPGGYAPYINPNLRLGNIVDEGYSLLPIWRHSEVLKRFREKSFEVQLRCLRCPEKKTICPGASVEMEIYRETTPDKKNPYCLY